MESHRCHDYHHLIRRWRSLCRRRGLKIAPCAKADGYTCHEIVAPGFAAARQGIYISAGIHGDEPAACEGLIAWAERTARDLASLPLLIYPCLNPWGLVNNCRTDSTQRDLNRVWDDPPTDLIRHITQRIAGREFALALTLHEDYDGQGLYIYEPGARRGRQSWGGSLLASAASQLPADGRATIDGRRARAGLIRPRVGDALRTSQPEAVYLHLHHARRTYTFETPSEFALDRRVAAQAALIDKSLDLLESAD